MDLHCVSCNRVYAMHEVEKLAGDPLRWRAICDSCGLSFVLEPELRQLEKDNIHDLAWFWGCDHGWPGFAKGARAKEQWLNDALAWGYSALMVYAGPRLMGILEYCPIQTVPYPLEGKGYLVITCIHDDETGYGIGHMLLNGVEKEAERLDCGILALPLSGAVMLCRLPYFDENWFRDQLGRYTRRPGWEPLNLDGYMLAVRRKSNQPLPRWSSDMRSSNVEVELTWHPACPRIAASVDKLREACKRAGVSFHETMVTDHASAVDAGCGYNFAVKGRWKGRDHPLWWPTSVFPSVDDLTRKIRETQRTT